MLWTTEAVVEAETDLLANLPGGNLEPCDDGLTMRWLEMLISFAVRSLSMLKLESRAADDNWGREPNVLRGILLGVSLGFVLGSSVSFRGGS